MEWMAVIGDSIQYIEEHITDDITTDNIAKAVNVSPTAVGRFPLKRRVAAGASKGQRKDLHRMADCSKGL